MKDFKVLLVYPNLQMINLLPSNISILSACLKKEGFQVDLFDTTFYQIDPESIDEKRVQFLQLRPFDYSEYGIEYKKTDVLTDFQKKIQIFKPDIIAITIVEDTIPLALKLLESIRDTDIPVIAGGVYVNLSPDESIQYQDIDYICYGEGEEALPELCNRLLKGECVDDIRNIWSKNKGQIIKNPMRPLVDLNKIPYNDFSIFEEKRFFRPMQGKIFRMIPIEIDRGCPYQCTYCAAPFLRSLYKKETGQNYYRIKTNERIISELEHQIQTYKAEYIYFNSETFLALSDEKFQEFAEQYTKRIHLPFWCQTRIETIKENKITLLEKMGCNRLSVGIEHGNEIFRKEVLKKNFTNKQVLEAFEILGRHKIPVTVNNMMGFPGETRELIFDTIHLNRKINIDSTNCFAFTPYKGTYLREVAVREGYLKLEEKIHSIVDSTLNMPQITHDEILGLLRTFPLYIKMPEERFEDIRKAEENSESGNLAFKKLAEEYQKKYW
nr:radical SAM protein [uncultured Methanoregula sp.]